VLQTVSNARREPKVLQTVHKLLQSVAKRENLLIQPADAVTPFEHDPFSINRNLID
jgi:hypothetical protein